MHLLQLFVRGSNDLNYVWQAISFYIFVKLWQSLFDVSIGQFLISVNIKWWICVDFQQPGVQIFIYQYVKAQNLETSWIGVIGANKAVICILEIRFESNNCLLSYISNLLHQVTSVFTFRCKILHDRSEQLFWGLIIILKLFTWSLKSLRVLVKTKISQMHIEIFDVGVIRLFIIMSAESCKAFITKICFNRIYSSN